MQATDIAARRRLAAAIHAASNKLGMDSRDKNPASDYRAMLAAQSGGKTSTTAMAEPELRAVLKHLLRTLNPGPQAKPKDGWHAAKMRALWADLAAIPGALTDPTERGLDKFIHSQTRIASARFLTSAQGNRIVEALKAWLARERAKK